MIRNEIINIYQLVKFDLKSRYAKTGLGQIWYIVSPVVMLFIYTVIFSDFMSARLGISDQAYSYSIYLVPGLFAFSAFSGALAIMIETPFAKAGILKKVSTPLYAFELSPLIIQYIIFAFSMFIGILFLAAVKGLSLNLLFLIPLMALQFVFTFGLGLLFSVFSVFFRDIKEVVPIVLQLLFWATPIVYPAEIIEKKAPILLDINPRYYFIKPYQNIFLFDEFKISDFIAPFFAASVAFLLGFYFYKKLISAVKDVL